MKKNTVRLTESQLHRVIKESVNKILTEMGETFGYRSTGRFLVKCGFQCVADYDIRKYFERSDMPIPFEKKIWDDEGQIIVEVDLYPQGNGTPALYSAVCKFGHGDYDIEEEEGNSEDLMNLAQLKQYLKQNDLLRWD